jgi:hypothetical protein
MLLGEEHLCFLLVQVQVQRLTRKGSRCQTNWNNFYFKIKSYIEITIGIGA